MRKLTIFTVMLLIFSLFLTGCGLISDQSKDSEKNKADSNDKEDLTGAQAAQSTGKQPWFEAMSFGSSCPPCKGWDLVSY